MPEAEAWLRQEGPTLLMVREEDPRWGLFRAQQDVGDSVGVRAGFITVQEGQAEKAGLTVRCCSSRSGYRYKRGIISIKLVREVVDPGERI